MRLIALLLLAGCAGGSAASSRSDGSPLVVEPERDLTATRADLLRTAALKFPSSEYMVGYGAGATPEEAESRAMADAAGLIESEITSNMRVTQVDMIGHGEQVATQEVVRKVKSDIGAFVFPARDLTKKSGKRYEAVATIKREDLARKYQEDARPKVERLEGLWTRILEDPTNPSIAQAYCEADRIEKDVEQQRIVRLVATKRELWSADQASKRQQVRQLREDMKKGSDVQIVRPAGAEGLPVIADDIAQVLGKKGWGTRLVDAAECGKGRSLVIAVEVPKACGEASYGGYLCELSLKASGRRCNEAGGVFEVKSPSAKAVHQSNVDLAAKAAVGRIDVKKFQAELEARTLEAVGEGCAKAP